MKLSKTACNCKSCGIITKHDATEDANVFACQVCGTTRHYAKSFGAGDFPELTHHENETVHEARANGFGSCFPCYPTAESQARNTLAGARRHLAMLAARAAIAKATSSSIS